MYLVAITRAEYLDRLKVLTSYIAGRSILRTLGSVPRIPSCVFSLPCPKQKKKKMEGEKTSPKLKGPPSPPAAPHNLPIQTPKEARRFPKRQEDGNGRRAKDPAERDDDPGGEEALREDVVGEEHGDRDHKVHGEGEQEGRHACEFEGPVELFGLVECEFVFLRFLLFVGADGGGGLVAVFFFVGCVVDGAGAGGCGERWCVDQACGVPAKRLWFI